MLEFEYKLRRGKKIVIFNIQRYSTHDGEGIRTMVFLKGCPLRCQWCSNPESQTYDKQLFFDSTKCIGCGSCVEVSPNGEFTLDKNGIHYNPVLCTDPTIFEDICPTKAIEVVGEDVNVDDLIETLEKDHLFYNKSGGGVTFSGGEALSQSKMLEQALSRLKALGIHTAIETCLDVPWHMIERVVPYVDLFMVDLKHIDKDKLYQFTKGNADNIQKNLKQLSSLKANVIIRIPVIPSFNHSDEEIEAMLSYVKEIGTIEEVHFLPYHTYGAKKYELLGMPYLLQEASIKDEDLDKYIEFANNKGLKAKIGG